MKIWLGTGGTPDSVLRAVELGLPMFLGILGGTADHWAQYGTAYRQAWAELGHPAKDADIAVAVHGFVAADDRQAKATYLEHDMRMFATGAAEAGRAPMAPTGREDPQLLINSAARVRRQPVLMPVLECVALGRGGRHDVHAAVKG